MKFKQLFVRKINKNIETKSQIYNLEIKPYFHMMKKKKKKKKFFNLKCLSWSNKN